MVVQKLLRRSEKKWTALGLQDDTASEATSAAERKQESPGK